MDLEIGPQFLEAVIKAKANFSTLGIADFRCYEGFADVVDKQLGGAFFFEEDCTNNLIGDSQVTL